MSYSFTVRAANKQAAKAAVAAKFDEVATQQACHHRDKAQACAAADAFVDLLNDDDSKDVVVAINGSLMGQWTGSDVTLIESAAVSITAYAAKRES